MWLKTCADICKFSALVTNVISSENWTALVVTVQYGNKTLDPINTQLHHVSLFANRIDEVQFVSMLQLPKAIKITGSYSATPNVFQTSMLVSLLELENPVHQALALWDLSWYKTTAGGTKFHLAL